MTNNPTIDGVSRELRELLERVAYRLSDLRQCDLSEAIFTILSKPSKCSFCDDKKSVCVDWEAGEWMSCPKCSPESDAPAVERQDASVNWQAVATEQMGIIDQRQSTISQLQAQNEKLIDSLTALKNSAYNIGGEHVCGLQPLIDAADKAEEVISFGLTESSEQATNLAEHLRSVLGLFAPGDLNSIKILIDATAALNEVRK